MSSTNTPFDIVICGGGMVGLSMGLALADSGLRTALLDAGPAPASFTGLTEARTSPEFDNRVSALTPASQALLESLGVWGPLQKARVSPYADMRVWDADGTGAIHFSADELHIPCLGHIVENRLVTSALQEALTANGKVTVMQGIGLENWQRGTGDSDAGLQKLQLSDGSELTCRLLIGADGSRSRIRELAGFSTRSWSYGQQAIVCTVRTERDHQQTAWQRFMDTGPLAFLPLYLPANRGDSTAPAPMPGVGEIGSSRKGYGVSDKSILKEKVGAHIKYSVNGNEQGNEQGKAGSRATDSRSGSPADAQYQSRAVPGSPVDGQPSGNIDEISEVSEHIHFGTPDATDAEPAGEAAASNKYHVDKSISNNNVSNHLYENISSNHYCSIVWSCEPWLASELLALDNAAFEARLGRAFEHRLGSVAVISKRQSFPLHQQHATCYIQSGIALIGDAAHTIHPLAGQGVNLGLADVVSLNRILRAAMARREPWWSEQVLSRYQRECKPRNLGMMFGMEVFKRVFGNEELLLRWLRNTGLKAADTLTPIKLGLMKKAMGLK